MNVVEYRALAERAPRRNKDPEHAFQCAVVRGLRLILPAAIDWTASAAGVRVSMHVAKKMKAAGQRRGWGDLQFLFPDRITRYLELKTLDGALSADQRAFRDRWEPLGLWRKARTWDQVHAALAAWCVEAGLPPLGALDPVSRARLGL